MADTSQLAAGQTLGPCTIESRLGAGAMGVVYKARHPDYGEIVLKVIKQQNAPDGTMLRRFHREAKAAMRVQSEYVVRCFGLEEWDGSLVLLQEFVGGGDLDGYAKANGGKLSMPEALRIGREVALGLKAAHEAGLVHRDLKPGNVLLTSDRRAKLGDLGLVLQVDGEPIDGRTILTQKGQALGTPLYMAPEQWMESHDVDARADLYALGVMLHRLISGKRPLKGKNLSTLMRAHLMKPPKPLSEDLPGAPPAVEKAILRLLEKEPDDRPASAALVALGLERIADQLGIGDLVRGVESFDKTMITPPPAGAAPIAGPGSDSAVDPSSLGTMVMAPPPSSQFGSGSSSAYGNAADFASGSSHGAPATGGPAPTRQDHTTPPGQSSSSALAASNVSASNQAMPGARAAIESMASGNPEALVGQVVGGKFEVESVLGQGGMGVVYKAHHTLLGNHYALKLLLPKFARDPEFRSRFLREAKVMQAFTHEGAVTLRDFGEHHGSLYMALDFVQGQELGKVLKTSGPWSEQRILNLARQVLPCLQTAHDAGLVHRDLKPANMLVENADTDNERIKVLDFGIAKAFDEAIAANMEDANLTGTGVTLGTPHYMSPEQDAGDPVDGRSDIYSFACILYELAAGKRPLRAPTVRKLRYKIQFEEPEALVGIAPTISPRFSAAVMKGLTKDRDGRPATAMEFLEILEKGLAASSGDAPADGDDDMTVPMTAHEQTVGLTAHHAASGGSKVVPVVVALVLLICALGAAGLWLLGRGEPLEIAAIKTEGLTNKSTVTVTGQANQGPVRVRINGGGETTGKDDGSFEIAVPLERDGEQTINVEIIGPGGRRQSRKLTVRRDTRAPKLELGAAGKVLDPAQSPKLSGRVTDPGGAGASALSVTLTVDDGEPEPLALDSEQRFEADLSRLAGSDKPHRLVLEARDGAGNVQKTELTTRAAFGVSVEETTGFTQLDTAEVSGRAGTGAGEVTVEIVNEATGGALPPVKAGGDGSFAAKVPLAEGENRIRIVARAEGQDPKTVYIDRVRDGTAPVLTLNVDQDREKGTAFVNPNGRIVGHVEDETLESVTLDGVALEVNDKGDFATELKSRRDGEVLTLIAVDKAGNRAERKITVTDRILFKDLEAPTVTREDKVTIKGRVTSLPATVTVRQGDKTVAAEVDKEGQFTASLKLAEGRTSLGLIAKAKNDTEARAELVVTVDRTKPELELDGVKDGAVRLNAGGLLAGRIKDETPELLEIDGQAVKVGADGRFKHRFAIFPRPREVEFKARDKAGNVVETKVRVVPMQRFVEPAEQSAPIWTALAGWSLPLRLNFGPGEVKLKVGGETKTVPVPESGVTSTVVDLSEGENTITLTLEGAEGPDARRRLVVTLDTTRPRINISGLSGTSVELDTMRRLRGTVVDAAPESIKLGETELELGAGDSFSYQVEDLESPQTLTFTARDQAGNVQTLEVTVMTPRAIAAVNSARGLLDDRTRWNAANRAEQGLAVQYVQGRLSKDWLLSDQRQFSCGGASHRIAIFRHVPTGLEFCLIPGGDFQMGSKPEGAASDELPRHPVRIRPMLMSRTELPKSVWVKVMGAAPKKGEAMSDEQPAVGMTWIEAREFMTRANSGFRMPTESEWEYACRAGTTTPYYWGPTYDKAYARTAMNAAEGTGKRQPLPVTKQAGTENAFGLLNMLGNVEEYCADGYVDSYRGAPGNGEARPIEPSDRKARAVVRGGGFRARSDESRCANRKGWSVRFPKDNIGIRVAVSLDLD